jgi:bacillithiol biosynthesis deacetylase BshB1
MKILAIGAHPDDVEFGCGALMIKEAQKGSQIKYVTCSLGEAGSNGTPEGRKREAEEAAKMVGADIEFLDFGGDCHIEYKPQNAFALAKIIREFKPNAVLTQQLKDNQHPDHAAIAKLVRDACRMARFGGLREIKNLPTHRIDGLYYFSSSADFDGQPDILIDVTDYFEKWQQTMSCHKSQMKTTDYLELANTKTAALGRSIGIKYAVGLWKNDPIRLDSISDITLSSRNY